MRRTSVKADGYWLGRRRGGSDSVPAKRLQCQTAASWRGYQLWFATCGRSTHVGSAADEATQHVHLSIAESDGSAAWEHTPIEACVMLPRYPMTRREQVQAGLLWFVRHFADLARLLRHTVFVCGLPDLWFFRIQTTRTHKAVQLWKERDALRDLLPPLFEHVPHFFPPSVRVAGSALHNSWPPG